MEKLRDALHEYLLSYTNSSNRELLVHKLVSLRYEEPLIFMAKIDESFYKDDKDLKWEHYTVTEAIITVPIVATCEYLPYLSKSISLFILHIPVSKDTKHLVPTDVCLAKLVKW